MSIEIVADKAEEWLPGRIVESYLVDRDGWSIIKFNDGTQLHFWTETLIMVEAKPN